MMYFAELSHKFYILNLILCAHNYANGILEPSNEDLCIQLNLITFIPTELEWHSKSIVSRAIYLGTKILLGN